MELRTLNLELDMKQLYLFPRIIKKVSEIKWRKKIYRKVMKSKKLGVYSLPSQTLITA